MKETKIVPMGGLCNRIRTIASGYATARKLGQRVTVYWNRYAGLQAAFGELFCPPTVPDLQICENSRWLYAINFSRDYYLRWPLLHLLPGQCVFGFNAYDRKDILPHLKNAGEKPLLIVSCSPTCLDYDLNGLFIPKPHIQQRIDRVVQTFSPHTIGVHIRRTDNTMSIECSPLDVFIQMMTKEIEKDSTVKFYVASDSKDVKQTLQEKFPERVIILYDDTDRDTLEGMEFAVVDLFCLSKTSKIIGSVYSSYSHIAAEFGGIEVEYARILASK